jgi:diacylglycerol O-acyltransferase / wax synthase
VEASNEGWPPIERASPADLAFLAMDTGRVPEQFAVILILERPGDLKLLDLRQLIGNRILAMPRLRQRLIKVPIGYRHPVWVDDLDFTIDRHVRAVSCRPPGDEVALLDTALSVIITPLPRDHPLWSIVLIPELADGAVAVVFVLHHVLADGLGGLNVLPPSSIPERRLPTCPSRGRRRDERCLLGTLGRRGWTGFVARPGRGGPCGAACSRVEAFIPRAQPTARSYNGQVPGAAWRFSGWIAPGLQRQRIATAPRPTMRS